MPSIPYTQLSLQLPEPKLCECGCGTVLPLATKTCARYNAVIGQPRRFIQGHVGRLPSRPTVITDNETFIPLGQNGICHIDPEDADLDRFKWHISHFGYAIACLWDFKHKQVTTIQMHRIILERKLGYALQPGKECDHKNGNRLDNRRENLRLATHQQNSQNTKLCTNNTSGYKGVTFCKQTGRWKAQIQIGGRGYSLGRFATPEEASIVYERAAAEAFGEWKRDTRAAGALPSGRGGNGAHG